MDIHFNTTSMTPADALGLVALLAQLFPGMGSEEAPTAPLPLRHVPNATTAAALDAAERGEVTPLESIAALSDDDDAAPAADAPTHDADGLPWDERIHSANKAVTADGKWRKRRNVSDTVMAQVTAELRGSAPLASVPPAPPPSPPLAPLPPVVPAAPAPLPPPEAPAVEPVAPPPLPVAPPAPVATGGVEAPDFQAFALIMQKVTGALSAGTLVQSEVDQFVSHAGVAQLRDLAGSKAARDVFDVLLSAKLGA